MEYVFFKSVNFSNVCGTRPVIHVLWGSLLELLGIVINETSFIVELNFSWNKFKYFKVLTFYLFQICLARSLLVHWGWEPYFVDVVLLGINVGNQFFFFFQEILYDSLLNFQPRYVDSYHDRNIIYLEKNFLTICAAVNSLSCVINPQFIIPKDEKLIL